MPRVDLPTSFSTLSSVMQFANNSVNVDARGAAISEVGRDQFNQRIENLVINPDAGAKI
jgi:hypothetical protein